MDVSRARRELGWSATRSSGDALLELIDAMRRGDGIDTPPLAPGSNGPLRLGSRPVSAPVRTAPPNGSWDLRRAGTRPR
jgi:hypothetical protein